MTLSINHRLRSIHFDTVMAVVRAHRADSITVPVPKEAIMSVPSPLPLLPMFAPSTPIPAYVAGVCLPGESLRQIAAVKNALAPFGVEWRSQLAPEIPTKGVFDRIAFRTDEARVDVLTPEFGPSIVVLRRHGIWSTRVALEDDGIARNVAVGYLRHLAGHHDELPVVLAFSGRSDMARDGIDASTIREQDLVICLPADPAFEVARSIPAPTRTPVPEHRIPTSSPRRPASTSGIPADMSEQPHGAGRRFQAEVARKANEARKLPERDGRHR